jgi:ParB family chromosome partitioning protein
MSTVEHVALAKVQPAADNPRVHPAEQIDRLVDSMREFGFPQPILVTPQLGILAGHGRLEAAARIYAEGGAIPHVPKGKVPVVRIDGMSEVEQRAYRIADNRLAALSMFDPALLSAELSDLSGEGVDPALLGFSALDMLRLDEDLARTQLQGMHTDDPPESASFDAPRDDEPSERTVRLAIVIPAVDRQVIYDALVKARAQFGASNSGDALAAMLDFIGALT